MRPASPVDRSGIRIEGTDGKELECRTDFVLGLDSPSLRHLGDKDFSVAPFSSMRSVQNRSDHRVLQIVRANSLHLEVSFEIYHAQDAATAPEASDGIHAYAAQTLDLCKGIDDGVQLLLADVCLYFFHFRLLLFR